MRGTRLLKDERGAALLVALLVGFLLAGLGAIVITVANIETLIAAAHRRTLETSCAADAAFERALRDLDVLPDWNAVLAPYPSNAQSTFVDGLTHPRTPDGRTLDLQALTMQRQAESEVRAGPAVFGPDAPQWRLFAHAGFASILPAGAPAPPAYLVVWVADDGLDGDGDPSRDANGRVLVFAEAWGAAGTRRVVQGVASRPADGILRVLSRRSGG